MTKGEEKAGSIVCFPEGLKILIVDCDSTSLDEISKWCLECHYEVTTTTTATEALCILGDTRGNFDIVLCDTNVPDMDPLCDFVEFVAVKMDLPLVLMSNNDYGNSVKNGLYSGASDYLIKPIELNQIKLIWKNVIRKQKYKAMEQAKTSANVENCQILLSGSENVNVIDNENVVVGCSSSEVGREDDDIQNNEIPQKSQKQRVVWTSDLHKKFVTIVDQVGIQAAGPKTVLEMMNTPGLSRENVASHLQKYRLYLKKEEESKKQKHRMQSQAINFELNRQSYNHSIQNNFQQLVQRPSNPIVNQSLPGNYLVSESRLGLLTDNGIRRSTVPVHQFSGIGISDNHNLEPLNRSLPLQRPPKVPKLSHVEATSYALGQSTTNSSTTNDVSTRLSSAENKNSTMTDLLQYLNRENI